MEIGGRRTTRFWRWGGFTCLIGRSSRRRNRSRLLGDLLWRRVKQAEVHLDCSHYRYGLTVFITGSEFPFADCLYRLLIEAIPEAAKDADVAGAAGRPDDQLK